MIAFIEGILEEKGLESVIIYTGGIGYEVRIPSSVLDNLPNAGQTVRLYTYLQIREDAVGLFGFLSREDLEFFKMLITVNGVGPKAALGILSAIPSQELRFAIMAGDDKAITKAPGIGGKTASKIILELRDKVQNMAADNIKSEFYSEASPTGNKAEDTKGAASLAAIRRDAAEALTALGYSPSQAHQAVAKVPIEKDTDVEMVLKMALKYLYQ